MLSEYKLSIESRETGSLMSTPVLSDSAEYALPTESLTWENFTILMTAVASVGINAVETVDLSALPVAVSLLVGPLRFIVGFSTLIVALTGCGRTSAFLFPDLGIVSSIVVL